MKLKKLLLRPETAVLLLLLVINTQFMWRREHWRHFVLSTDGRGYYGYLTAGFIYHDLTYAKSSEAIEEAFGFEMSHHYVLKDTEGNIFNKTFPGVAICMAPLFLVAYFLSWILGYDPNGYNTLFLLSIQFSPIFFDPIE